MRRTHFLPLKPFIKWSMSIALILPTLAHGANSALSDQEVLKHSSSAAIKADKALIIIDNDAAYDSKIKAIQSAQSGETIRMVYYIYSNDHSSSHFTHALLDAAARGVKIKLLVDYLTNYKLVDLFNMIEAKGNGNIEVRLYGRPSPMVMRDAIYMTRPCPQASGPVQPKQCSNAKWTSIEAEIKGKELAVYSDFYSSLLLAGLASKSGTALKLAFLVGQQIDIEAIKADDPNKTPEQKQKEKEQLSELLKLIFQARFQHSVSAKLKLAVAMTMYASDINPVLNLLDGTLPLSPLGVDSSNDWEHVTDYTHHKLLTVEDKNKHTRFFQLGGRNIENSYHMKKNDLSARYTFIDTDFAASVKSGGEGVSASFDRLFNYSYMSISLKELNQTIPNSMVANADATGKAAQVCMSTLDPKDARYRNNLATCLTQNFLQNGGKTLQQRIADEYQTLLKNEQDYLTKYVNELPQNWEKDTKYAFELSSSDLNTVFLTYLENLHFDKTAALGKEKRVYGAPVKQAGTSLSEYDPGRDVKNIHSVWTRALENVCKNSASGNVEKRVVFHTAYLIFPSNLLRSLAKMIDGSWDCHNVKVTMITNSFETTDLNVINVYAKYQLKALFEVYQNRGDWSKTKFPRYANAAKKAAKFEYFEYAPPAADSNGQRDVTKILSLHTKLTVLGDDIILGSANSDARSYYMDTNNGIFIRNAPQTTKSYLSFIDQLISSGRLNNETAQFNNNGPAFDHMFAVDKAVMEALKIRFPVIKKILKDANDETRLLNLQQGIAMAIYNDSITLLKASYSIDNNGVVEDFSAGGSEATRVKKVQEKMDDYDTMLQLL